MQKTMSIHTRREIDAIKRRIGPAKTLADINPYKAKKGGTGHKPCCDKSKEAILPGLSKCKI